MTVAVNVGEEKRIAIKFYYYVLPLLWFFRVDWSEKPTSAKVHNSGDCGSSENEVTIRWFLYVRPDVLSDVAIGKYFQS